MIRFFLLDSSPNWLVLLLAAGLALQVWRVGKLQRMINRHARSIANMDAWADVTEERLDRVDWSRMHQAANDRLRIWRRSA